MALRCALVVLVCLLGACAEDPTQIVIEVRSDLSVPDDLDRVTVLMRSPEGREQSAEALLGPGQLPLPRVLGMIHEGGALGPFDVTVTGLRASNERVQRRGQLTFEPGRIRLWTVELLAACRGVSCGADETCADAGCRSVVVGTDELLPWDDREVVEDGGVQCVDELCNERDDDCDGRVDEGIDTESDDANCGECGVDCADVPNAVAECRGGTCSVVSCDAGFGDCTPEDGCETNTASDAMRCGDCATECRPPDRVCCAGTCARDCP